MYMHTLCAIGTWRDSRLHLAQCHCHQVSTAATHKDFSKQVAKRYKQKCKHTWRNRFMSWSFKGLGAFTENRKDKLATLHFLLRKDSCVSVLIFKKVKE